MVTVRVITTLITSDPTCNMTWAEHGAVDITDAACEGMYSMEMVSMFVARFSYYSDIYWTLY
jgi:hypothetical protein